MTRDTSSNLHSSQTSSISGTSSISSSFSGSGYESLKLPVLSPTQQKQIQRRSVKPKSSGGGGGTSIFKRISMLSPTKMKEERDANKKFSNMFDF